MFSGLIAFLGGSAFRMLWGEISQWMRAKQDHQHELEMLRANIELENIRHTNSMDALKVQADLGVKLIAAKSEAVQGEIETSAWAGVVASTYKATGIVLIDAWNQSIRPLLATVVIVCWCMSLYRQGFAFTDWDRDLASAILGVFIADRVFFKRGQ